MFGTSNKDENGVPQMYMYVLNRPDFNPVCILTLITPSPTCTFGIFRTIYNNQSMFICCTCVEWAGLVFIFTSSYGMYLMYASIPASCRYGVQREQRLIKFQQFYQSTKQHTTAIAYIHRSKCVTELMNRTCFGGQMIGQSPRNRICVFITKIRPAWNVNIRMLSGLDLPRKILTLKAAIKYM